MPTLFAPDVLSRFCGPCSVAKFPPSIRRGTSANCTMGLWKKNCVLHDDWPGDRNACPQTLFDCRETPETMRRAAGKAIGTRFA